MRDIRDNEFIPAFLVAGFVMNINRLTIRFAPGGLKATFSERRFNNAHWNYGRYT
jgi:hypothetical protein